MVGFSASKVAYEHIYWDQASLLVQIGLLDAAKLPVTGAEQAHRSLDPAVPCNELIRRAKQKQAMRVTGGWPPNRSTCREYGGCFAQAHFGYGRPRVPE